MTRFVLALAIVGLAGFFLAMFVEPSVEHMAVAAGIFAIYLVLAYFARPEADPSNVGWAGGLIDHPFRYSHDVNRFLVALKVVLLPGRFVSEAFVELFRHFRHS